MNGACRHRALPQRAEQSALRHDAPAASRAHAARVNLLPGNGRDIVDRHGHVVILVEDDAGLRAALERMLRASGFEAQAYASAEAALADHGRNWADCLVVDLNLPKMSGLDLIDCLRQRGVTAPAVIITAHDKPSVRAEVQRRGIEHFLAKPFPGSTLVRLLDDVIAAGSGGARSG
jgi:FixJ family two-component response regulator